MNKIQKMKKISLLLLVFYIIPAIASTETVEEVQFNDYYNYTNIPSHNQETHTQININEQMTNNDETVTEVPTEIQLAHGGHRHKRHWRGQHRHPSKSHHGQYHNNYPPVFFPLPPPPVSNICRQQLFFCYTPVPLYIGSACYCLDNFGNFLFNGQISNW